MSFKISLVIALAVALILPPVAASAEPATYLDAKGELHTLANSNPLPDKAAPYKGMVWWCPAKDDDPNKRPLIAPSCKYVFKDATSAEAAVPNTEQKVLAANAEPNCYTWKADCELPANLKPHGDYFRLENPNCAPGLASTQCRWINVRMADGPQMQPAPAPKPEKEPKRYGTGTVLAVGLLGLVAGAALGANGGRGSYYNYGCYCYTSYRDAGSAYNTYRQR